MCSKRVIKMAKIFKVNYADWVAMLLIVVGAINWGLVGIAYFVTDGANWNVVNLLLGGTAWAEFGVYSLVGIAGLYGIYFAYRLTTVERAMPETEVTGRKAA
jgi:hypothetical protein